MHPFARGGRADTVKNTIAHVDGGTLQRERETSYDHWRNDAKIKVSKSTLPHGFAEHLSRVMNHRDQSTFFTVYSTLKYVASATKMEYLDD